MKMIRNMNFLTDERLKNGISLVDIAENLNKENFYVVKNCRFAEADGLISEIKKICKESFNKSDGIFINELEELLASGGYNDRIIDFSNPKYIEIGLYKGYRNAEESWKFFNMKKENFIPTIEKDYFNEIIESD